MPALVLPIASTVESSPASASLLQLKEISVRHWASSSLALEKIDLQVQAGEQIAIIGPSGAGKTTLLHLLAGAIAPDTGEFSLMGLAFWQQSNAVRHDLRRQLFLAPQTPPLPSRQRVVTAVLAGRLPHWTLWQALRNLIKPLDPVLAWQALSCFQLQDKLYARVDRLSGGERQRCALARLLVSDARLLLVDEPLSALDPGLAEQTLLVLQDEAKQRNATLICSLHQVELARTHFSRIIGLRDGRIFFDSQHSGVPSDVMIAALYQNARSESAQQEPDFAERVAMPVNDLRCF
jgi:phosphonate transport system ATP-binding protein